MKKRIIALLVCMTMVLPLAACNREPDLPQETQISGTETDDIIEYDEMNHPVDVAVMDFAVRLLQTDINMQSVAECSPDSSMNRLISPLSVLTAMAMVSNGAEGETLAQMEETFGVSTEELNQYISSYMSSLPQEEGNRFHMANSVWVKEDGDFQVQEEFLNKNKTYYDADIYEAAFEAGTVEKINTWVEENTDGLIKEIINEIPADAVMYVINALVFDAKWEETYDEIDIHEGVFTISEDLQQDVEFMHSEESLYLEDENATGFIKYYEGRDYAFVALLPKEGLTLSEYINTLSGESLHALLSNPQEVKVRVWIPQFDVEYHAELGRVLTEMGMEDLFDAEKADLSALGTSSEGNLWVDRVIHKTYMELSPVGTKAGAATAVEIRLESASMDPLDMKEVGLDRPFFYMIIDCENKQPIFMGTLNYVEAYRCGIMDDVCSYPLAE